MACEFRRVVPGPCASSRVVWLSSGQLGGSSLSHARNGVSKGRYNTTSCVIRRAGDCTIQTLSLTSYHAGWGFGFFDLHTTLAVDSQLKRFKQTLAAVGSSNSGGTSFEVSGQVEEGVTNFQTSVTPQLTR